MCTNYCVACGQEIPEGDMICSVCKKKSETKTIKVKHKDNKPFVLKKWSGDNWDKPDVGDIVKIFGTDFEVISNEPGNVELKKVNA